MLRRSIMPTRTRCQGRPRLEKELQCRLGRTFCGLMLHRPLHKYSHIHRAKLEFGAPTITDGIYTSLGCRASMKSKCFPNFLARIQYLRLLRPLLQALLGTLLRDTIGELNKAQLQLRFGLLSGFLTYGLLFFPANPRLLIGLLY